VHQLLVVKTNLFQLRQFAKLNKYKVQVALFKMTKELPTYLRPELHLSGNLLGISPLLATKTKFNQTHRLFAHQAM